MVALPDVPAPTRRCSWCSGDIASDALPWRRYCSLKCRTDNSSYRAAQQRHADPDVALRARRRAAGPARRPTQPGNASDFETFKKSITMADLRRFVSGPQGGPN